MFKEYRLSNMPRAIISFIYVHNLRGRNTFSTYIYDYQEKEEEKANLTFNQFFVLSDKYC